MPPLTNARHERFAQLMVQGKPASVAYQESGYAPSDGNAVRLKGNEKVQARISELQTQAAEKAIVTVERILEEWSHIGFSRISDVVEWDKWGVRPKELDQIPEHAQAAIQEISSTTTQFGINFKVRMQAKSTALDAMANYLQMFVDTGVDASEKAQELFAALQAIMGATNGGFQPPQAVDAVADDGGGSTGVDSE